MFLLAGVGAQDAAIEGGVALVEVRVAEGDGEAVVAAVHVEEASWEAVGLVVAVAGVVGVDAAVVVQVVGEGVHVGVETVCHGLVDAHLE